jgi:hypothetical protein
MKPGRFKAKVTEEGKLLVYNQKVFWAYMKRLAGHDVVVDIYLGRAVRSQPQNRYYWGVVVAILAEECGYQREEMHEALKWKFLRLEDPDHPIPTVRSTTDLTTQEFEEYLEQIRIWAASELGVVIPMPNEAVGGVD